MAMLWQWCYSAAYQRSVQSVSAEAADISDDCKKEVMEYKIQRNTNINKNVPLGESTAIRTCFVVHHQS